MTEPDEALIWARRWRSDNLQALGLPSLAQRVADGETDETLKDFALGYRAGQAASAERIKALEKALKNTVTAMRLLLDTVQKHNAESDIFLSGFPLHLLTIEIAQAEALLKEADQ